MNNVYGYLKKYPITLIALSLYFISWISLFIGPSIVIGEWPIAPVVALPFGIVMILNAIFRKGHRLFYLIISGIIFLPLFIISLNA